MLSGEVVDPSMKGMLKRGPSDSVEGNFILVTASRAAISASSYTSKYCEAVAAGVRCFYTSLILKEMRTGGRWEEGEKCVGRGTWCV
jgi:hypothetical protein